MLGLARRHWGLFALLALALGLRAWALDALPNPSGDEGNWTWIAFDLWKGRPAQLPPDARFVSMAFARMIAGAYALAGPSFAAARAVLVVGVLAGTVACYAACAAMGLRRAGLVVAAVMAVHPWSVLWSRTATVPYALALATGVAGPLVLLAALRARPGWRRDAALFGAAQLLFAGLHFTPLAAIPLVAAGLWVLARARYRAVLERPATWVALGVGALHALPVVQGALAVAERGATRPSRHLNFLAERLLTYGWTVAGGLGGEATVRHFVARAFPRAGEIAVMGAVVALVGAAAWQSGKSATEPAARELRAFALAYLALALVGMPLLLAPARPWNLPAVDAERYVFAVLAPFALVLGALAEKGTRAWAAALGFAGYLLVSPTARVAYGLLAGGGMDHGYYLLRGGGGFRGWKSAQERVALPWLIQREVDRVARRQPATILVADYAFHTLHFANAETPYPTVDVAKFPVPSRPGTRFFFVLWSEGIFAPGFDPAQVVDWNARLRARMLAEFREVRRLRAFVQPGGAPLCEVWTGVQR
jgi:hypothetical protein